MKSRVDLSVPTIYNKNMSYHQPNDSSDPASGFRSQKREIPKYQYQKSNRTKAFR